MKKDKKEKDYNKVKMEGVIAYITVVWWVMLFPFIVLYDRIFGGWKK